MVKWLHCRWVQHHALVKIPKATTHTIRLHNRQNFGTDSAHRELKTEQALSTFENYFINRWGMCTTCCRMGTERTIGPKTNFYTLRILFLRPVLDNTVQLGIFSLHHLSFHLPAAPDPLASSLILLPVLSRRFLDAQAVIESFRQRCFRSKLDLVQKYLV